MLDYNNSDGSSLTVSAQQRLLLVKLKLPTFHSAISPLSNTTLNDFLHACPRPTHLSLVNCRFLNFYVDLKMLRHQLEFVNLHQPHFLHRQPNDIHQKTRHIQITQRGEKVQYYASLKNSIHVNHCVEQEKSRFIYIKLHCFSVDQLYLLGSRIK